MSVDAGTGGRIHCQPSHDNIHVPIVYIYGARVAPAHDTRVMLGYVNGGLRNAAKYLEGLFIHCYA